MSCLKGRGHSPYHRVRLPESWISWKTGVVPGMTVGMGPTDEVVVGRGIVCEGLCLKGSIMVKIRIDSKKS